MFSSNKSDFGTPDEVYLPLHAAWNFVLDAAANKYNTKCERFISEEDDSLECDWGMFLEGTDPRGAIWLNPPYSRNPGLMPWLKKAYEESVRLRRVVVVLVPARTETGWWWKYALRADRIWFARGRIRFNGGDHTAPFPSALVVFDGMTVVKGGTPSVWWWEPKGAKTIE